MLNLFKKRYIALLAGILFMLLVVLIIGFGLFFIKPAESGGEYRIITVKACEAQVFSGDVCSFYHVVNTQITKALTG